MKGRGPSVFGWERVWSGRWESGRLLSMLRIGLTGGIAAGKSTASTRFRELGATVVDHDQLARKAVAPGSPGLNEIVRVFGDSVIKAGELDRAALAGIVFHNPSARAQLDAIVHPQVHALSKAADHEARTANACVVIHDIPLLVESKYGADGFDAVVTVSAAEDVRLRRLMETRGMSEADARARIAAQATDEERASIADVVFDGNDSEESLRAQVDEYWKLTVPADRTDV